MPDILPGVGALLIGSGMRMLATGSASTYMVARAASESATTARCFHEPSSSAASAERIALRAPSAHSNMMTR